MAKFQTTNNLFIDPQPDEIAETLLVEAGTANFLPTDEYKLISFLGLEQMSFDFMYELDFVPEEKGAPEIRAALHLGRKLIATQSGLSSKRKRWGMLHEIAHFILPEHRDGLFLDTDASLGWWTKARFEREANAIAAQLMFQGNRFTDESLSHPTSARIPIFLADKYGASFESAFRRYTERHVLSCALIVYDKLPRQLEDSDAQDSDYKIHYIITSPSFKRNYFSALEIKGGHVKGTELLKNRSWSFNDVVPSEFVVGRGPNEKPWHFESEIFSNGYKMFQFILPPKDTLQI